MNKKGILKAIEGVLAALILFSYTSSLFGLQTTYENWEVNTLKQENREFLSAFNKAGLNRLIEENKQGIISGVLSSFFGADVGYSIKTKDIIKPEIHVGVLLDPDTEIPQAFDDTICTPIFIGNPPQEPYLCGNFDGYNFVVTDENEEGSGYDFDTVYVDLENDGDYGDSGDGSYITNEVIELNHVWMISEMNTQQGPSMVIIKFLRAELVKEFGDHISTPEGRAIGVNDRNVTFIFDGVTTNSETWERIDVLIIPSYEDNGNPKFVFPEEENLKGFINKNGGVIEILDLTQTEIDPLQENIFGLKSVSYSKETTLPTGNELSKLSNIDVSKKSRQFRDLFYGTSIEVYMLNSGTGGHISSPNPESNYKNGDLSVYNGDYTIIIEKPSDSVYDRLYVDTDDDMLTEAEGPYSAGQTFKLNIENIFKIISIDPLGKYVNVTPDDSFTYILNNIENPSREITLYSKYDDEKYILVEQKGKVYDTTGNFDDIDGLIPTTCNILPEPFYEQKTWKLDLDDIGTNYEYCVVTIKTDASGAFTILYIDLNKDGNYNGSDEGPFFDGDLVRIGSEYYLITIYDDTGDSKWVLHHKWKVPIAISNYKEFGGKTVWIANFSGPTHKMRDDEWHLLKSLIMFVSDTNHDVIPTGKGYKTIISTSNIFISDKNMFLPYTTEFKTWHYI